MCRLFFFSLLFSLSFLSAGAQTEWPSPEIERVYQQGREALSRGDARTAASLFRQVADLAPDIPEGRRDLAQALVLTGDADGALRELDPLFRSRNADASVYRIGVQAYAAQKKGDAALKLLREGIRRNPESGELYGAFGDMEEASNRPEEALGAYLEGIERDPNYYLNYYKAANIYIFSKKLIWAILYAETFLLYEHQTPRATDVRNLLFSAYRRFFFPNATDDRLNPGSTRIQTGRAGNFEEAVVQTLRRQAPVISDGITTENLTMLRIRFLAEWTETYGRRYPYALFRYQDSMARFGVFDAYNQQLIGRAEQGSGFEAWNKMNPKAIPEFAAWAGEHPFRVALGEFYNTKRTKDVPYKKGG